MIKQDRMALPSVDHAPSLASPQRVGKLERNNLLLVLLGSLVFVALKDVAGCLAFLMGGMLTVVNLRLLRIIVKGMVEGTGKKGKGRLIAQVVLKFVGVMGVLTFIMLVVKPDGFAFLLGLSTLFLAVTLEGILGLFRSE